MKTHFGIAPFMWVGFMMIVALAAAAIAGPGKPVGWVPTQPISIERAPAPSANVATPAVPSTNEPVLVSIDGDVPVYECYVTTYTTFWNGIVSRFVSTVTNTTTGVSFDSSSLYVNHYSGARGGQPERGSGGYEYCNNYPGGEKG